MKFNDCLLHTNKCIANPTNITPNSQKSLLGATLVATKQSRKVIRNGLPRPLRGLAIDLFRN
jgi:hypothetical protein